MMEPKRLLTVGSPTARSLLRAGKRDSPPASLVPALMGALEGAPATPSYVAKLVRALWHAAFSKVSIGVAAVAAAGGGGYVVARMHLRVPRPEVTQQPIAAVTYQDPGTGVDLPMVVTEPTRPVAAPVETVQAASLSVAVATASPPVDRPARRHAVAVALQPTIATSSKPSIVGELDEMRRVRSLIVAGNGEAALDALDAYGVSHPAGTFEEESLALRVRALRLTGALIRAESTLDALEARFPNSVHLAAFKP